MQKWRLQPTAKAKYNKQRHYRTTILGKVVANEVVSSDNAQITAPAGIVVVSVDGESFKVVVK